MDSFLNLAFGLGVEEQDVLAAARNRARQRREERKSHEESLERTAVDEGQPWSGQHRLDLSDEEARVQQEKDNIVIVDHTATCKYAAKKKVTKVTCTGRGKGALPPVEEDEKPQQKMKQHVSCDRDVTPTGDEYDGEEEESSEEEEEKKEEVTTIQTSPAKKWNASRSRSRSRRRREPRVDAAGGTASCDCGRWRTKGGHGRGRTTCGLPPGEAAGCEAA